VDVLAIRLFLLFKEPLAISPMDFPQGRNSGLISKILGKDLEVL
jgi:hypothetical protein